MDNCPFTLQQEKNTLEAVMCSRQIYLAISALRSCLWQKFGKYHVLDGAVGRWGFFSCRVIDTHAEQQLPVSYPRAEYLD